MEGLAGATHVDEVVGRHCLELEARHRPHAAVRRYMHITDRRSTLVQESTAVARLFSHAAVLVSLALCGLFLSSTMAQADRVLEDEMRNPWIRTDEIRHWLFCGPFPNRMDGLSESAPAAPLKGKDTDFLAEHGGEAAIRPCDGLSHKLPDGTSSSWLPFTSLSDQVFFWRGYDDWAQYWVVGYAFTTVSRDEAGPAVLALHSLAPIKVWLNGQVVTPSDCWDTEGTIYELIQVEMQAGDNALLVKCDQRDGDPDDWYFSLAALSPEQAQRRDQEAFDPSVLSAVGTDGQPLTVLTDRTEERLTPPEGSVTIEVTAPGGKIVAEQTAARGERVEFSSARWSDGPYEIVLTLRLPDGMESIAYRKWYKGDPVAAVRRLVARAKDADTSTASGTIHQMLADRVLDRVGGDLDAVTVDRAIGEHSALMELTELDQASSGGPGGIRARGMVHLAYRDEVDGSPQFAQCFLPPGYTPEKKWPMIVYLHGRNSENPPYHRWSSRALHDSLADTYGAILVRPHGRGNTGYSGIGRQDVLRCIQLAKDKFSVDEDRVYLCGFSMGGMGTMHVGTRHPELFAALGVMSGAWDYHTQMDEETLSKLTPWERFQQEAWSSFTQAEQLLTTPLFAIHGELDGSVSVDGQRYGVGMLQRWGYDVRYYEVPGAYHIDTTKFHTGDLCDWLVQQTRVANPTEVRVRAADLRTASAHWLRVGQRENPVDFILASAKVVAPNVIRLDTENVLEVTLSPSDALVDPSQALRVVWNSADVRDVRLDAQGRVTLRAHRYRPTGLVKRPELPGPLSDVETTPYAIVVGTSSDDPDMREACRKYAQGMIERWQDWQHWTPRNFTDREISEGDLRQYSLILIGGPAENAITARLISQLPLEISSQGVMVDGHSFPAVDSAVKMVYPHPLNPDRYVAVIAATSAGAMVLAEGRLKYADFSILRRDGEGNDGDEPVVTSGFFDHCWRFNGSYLSTPESDATQ